MAALYESIGRTYTSTRRPDPRIAAQVADALGDAARVLNVGAGPGNYEPSDRTVIALDPSTTMLRQRPDEAASAVQGVAGDLPFRDNAFDAVMGTFTLHHWPDLGRGLAEARRVAPRQVFLTFEPYFAFTLWVLEYFPEILDLPQERNAPTLDDVRSHLAVREVRTVQVPADCSDGFGGAFWARPEAYLDPEVQAGMSMFAVLDPGLRTAGTERLRESLNSGDWDARFGHLRSMPSMDVGYRLVIAGDVGA